MRNNKGLTPLLTVRALVGKAVAMFRCRAKCGHDPCRFCCRFPMIQFFFDLDRELD